MMNPTVPWNALRRCRALLGVLPMLTACGGLSPPPLAMPDPAAVPILDRMSPNDCNPVLASALAGSNIPLANIRGLTYGLYRHESTGRIVRYDAWMGLKDQPGAIVVTLDHDCRPLQIYAREGARLPVAGP